MKDKLRKEIIIKRDLISENNRLSKDESIRNKLFSLPEFIKADTIFIYFSFRSEVDTFFIIEKALNKGKRVILPKVEKKKRKLYLYEINSIKDLSSGYMGIYEPIPDISREVGINEVDLIIVPGVCFDIYGNRIGYGGGYYDIILSEKKTNSPVIALSYEEQIVQKIPSEPHDIKVDIIITDQRIINAHESR
ncbi:MAG: 5-formyltetrahydrofolate cyclo-ligase [Nitrospirae bacterium]|nr:5-formyltetrahydrofolate cyclo-ligase [Nitrospirota bacterium]